MRILVNDDSCTASFPLLNKPTPMREPTKLCVVLTGADSLVAIASQTKAPPIVLNINKAYSFIPSGLLNNDTFRIPI